MRAYYWRGRTLVNLGRLDQGEDDFKTAVKFKPDYARRPMTILGWLASKQGRVGRGSLNLTKSVEFKPENGGPFTTGAGCFSVKFGFGKWP